MPPALHSDPSGPGYLPPEGVPGGPPEEEECREPAGVLPDEDGNPAAGRRGFGESNVDVGDLVEELAGLRLRLRRPPSLTEVSQAAGVHRGSLFRIMKTHRATPQSAEGLRRAIQWLKDSKVQGGGE